MGQNDLDKHEVRPGAGAFVVSACLTASIAALALWFSSAVRADPEERLAGPDVRSAALNGAALPALLAK